MTEPFTPEQRAALTPDVTNLDDGVFALRNLPEEVVAVLFAYYSRSRDDLRHNLLKLLDEGDLELAGAQSTTLDDSADSLAAARDKARQFHEKWVVGYGHGSVAEHACVHLALEGVSIIASKLVEDCRLASYTEKSTRYVGFDRTKIYVPESIAANPDQLAVYDRAIGALLDAYIGWTEDLVAKVKGRVARTEKQTERGYDNACRATAYDLLRYLLPAAIRTNIGVTVNARSLENMITKLASQPLAEGRELAERIKREAVHIVPTLLKYADHSVYRDETSEKIALHAASNLSSSKEMSAGAERQSGEVVDSGVRLVLSDPDADNVLAASILYGETGCAWTDLLGHVRALDTAALERIVDDYLAGRGKHDAPGRALERVSCTIEMTMDYGAYRDIQRHRMATQTTQALTPRLGFEMPDELRHFGFEAAYGELMAQAAEAYETLAEAVGVGEAAYVLPLATRVRVLFTWNLREVFHFVELRSARQGHPSYRKIAQQVYRAVEVAHPLVARYMRPNLKTYDLTRD